MTGFPWAVPLSFDFGIAAPEDAIPGTSLERVVSHCEDGKSLLLYQFRDKPRIEALLCALLEGVQDFDDAVWSVLIGRGLDWAVGVQLDGLGAIVDLPRRGWDGETYRKLLRAQILTLRSSGTWPDLLAVLRAMGFDLTQTEISEPGTAAIEIVLGEALVQIEGSDVFAFLERARAAGIRLTFKWPTTALASSFTLAPHDGVVTSADLGFGDSVAGDVGGYLASVLASSVEA